MSACVCNNKIQIKLGFTFCFSFHSFFARLQLIVQTFVMSMFWGTNALFPSSFFHGIKSFLPCLLSQKSIAAVRFLVNKPQHEIDPNYWLSVNIRGAITAITIRTILVTFGLCGVSAIQHNVVGRKRCYLLWCALVIPQTENDLRSKG